MDRKGREDQSSREDQCQYQKGKWSQKGTKGGFVFHRRETKLVRSIIRGQENGSITDYFPLLLDLEEYNGDKQLGSCKCFPNVLDCYPSMLAWSITHENTELQQRSPTCPKTQHDFFSLLTLGKNPLSPKIPSLQMEKVGPL